MGHPAPRARSTTSPPAIRPRLPRAATLAACALGVASIVGAAGRSAPRDEPPTHVPDGEDPVRECRVGLVNGTTLTGILMKSGDDEIVLRINGIDTTIERRRIANLRFLPTVEDRYERLRTGLGDNDINGRLTLVEWLRNRRAYDLALRELDGILEIDPDNRRADRLKRWIREQRRLRDNRSDPERDPARKTASDRSIPRTAPLSRLNEAQINLIRVYEVDLEDPPELRVPDDAMRALMERHPGSFPIEREGRDGVLELPEVEKLRLLFEHKARDLYPRVRVLEDPASMARFRRDIAGSTGWLTNACATSRCHGGTEAGGLRLVSREPNSDASVYTNFLILHSATLDDAPLINTNDPARSPLIQLAMVRAQSQHPHPEVDRATYGRGWRPVFRSPRDLGYRRVVDWIKSLYHPRPEYGIDYEPEAADADAAGEP